MIKKTPISTAQGIGFIFPHNKIKGSLFDYARSIDFIEEQVGLDLYYALPDRIEKNLEKQIDISFWEE